MGRNVFAAMLGATLVVAPLGCSLLLGEGFSDPRPTEAGEPELAPVHDDASELDTGAVEAAAASDVDAGDAPDAAPDPNVLVNPDFESPDCAGWSTEFAVATETAVSRSGSRGCLVCGVAGNFQAQFYQPVSSTVSPTAAYLGEVWVRAAPGEEAPTPAELYLEVDIRSGSASSPIQFGTATHATKPLSSEWERINAAVTSKTDAGTAIQLFLHFPAETRTCVVVDSARLVKTAN